MLLSHFTSRKSYWPHFANTHTLTGLTTSRAGAQPELPSDPLATVLSLGSTLPPSPLQGNLHTNFPSFKKDVRSRCSSAQSPLTVLVSLRGKAKGFVMACETLHEFARGPSLASPPPVSLLFVHTMLASLAPLPRSPAVRELALLSAPGVDAGLTY